jgi:hypothetical protein
MVFVSSVSIVVAVDGPFGNRAANLVAVRCDLILQTLGAGRFPAPSLYDYAVRGQQAGQRGASGL